MKKYRIRKGSFLDKARWVVLAVIIFTVLALDWETTLTNLGF